MDCCTGQSPGNEMTVLLVSLQATKVRGYWGWPTSFNFADVENLLHCESEVAPA